jgi:hypothetical protein
MYRKRKNLARKCLQTSYAAGTTQSARLPMIDGYFGLVISLSQLTNSQRENTALQGAADQAATAEKRDALR